MAAVLFFWKTLTNTDNWLVKLRSQEHISTRLFVDILVPFLFYFFSLGQYLDIELLATEDVHI